MPGKPQPSPHPLNRLRIARGWSAQTLADKAGVSLRTVQRIESGDAPSAKVYCKLKAVLPNLSYSSLIKFVNEQAG